MQKIRSRLAGLLWPLTLWYNTRGAGAEEHIVAFSHSTFILVEERKTTLINSAAIV